MLFAMKSCNAARRFISEAIFLVRSHRSFPSLKRFQELLRELTSACDSDSEPHQATWQDCSDNRQIVPDRFQMAGCD